MPAPLSRALYRFASWRVITPLLLLCAGYFWMFNYSPLPLSNPALVAAGCGEGLLDLLPYYDARAAYRALDCYGDTGRAIYRHYLLADTSFVFCYGLGFSLLLTRLLADLTALGSRWRKANLLPLGVALADVLENLGIYCLLVAYPRSIPVLGDLAGLATLLKFALTALALVALAGCLSTLLWRRIRF